MHHVYQQQAWHIRTSAQVSWLRAACCCMFSKHMAVQAVHLNTMVTFNTLNSHMHQARITTSAVSEVTTNSTIAQLAQSSLLGCACWA